MQCLNSMSGHRFHCLRTGASGSIGGQYIINDCEDNQRDKPLPSVSEGQAMTSGQGWQHVAALMSLPPAAPTHPMAQSPRTQAPLQATGHAIFWTYDWPAGTTRS
ncbi:uncharacterized protein LOC108032768 [Drosophila biarmipes]|uniref:uncharacterized protein LOC108032768 n=1 Tax=Drosophila biarmipes TaxID=125945 RepID=UPI0007E79A8C|nr:uncharacterized protein LOC108032768 [Drosophila biarmipes]